MIQKNNVYDIAKFWAIISVQPITSCILLFIGKLWLCSSIHTFFRSSSLYPDYLQIKISHGWYKKQILHLLVPFISCWTLYGLFLRCFDIAFISIGAFDDAKRGYWFILVLFLFNIFLGLLKTIMDKSQTIKVKYVVMLIPFFQLHFCVLYCYMILLATSL